LLAPDHALSRKLGQGAAHGDEAHPCLAGEFALGRQLVALVQSILVDVLQNEGNGLLVERSHGGHSETRSGIQAFEEPAGRVVIGSL
jgi:hypothetical protein